VFFQYAGSLNTTDAATWLHNIYTGAHDMVVLGMANPVSLVFSEMTDLSSSSAPQVIDNGTYTGTRGTTGIALGTAVVVRHHVNRRYRGGHSRNYLPGAVDTDLSALTQWTAGAQTNWLAYYTTYINAAIANTNPAAIGAITFVSVSYFSGFTNHTYPSGRVKPIPSLRATPLVDAIVSYSINPFPGSQRRRNQQP
jgi:hypothetical protein